MQRRNFISAVAGGLLGIALPASAQQPGRTWRIGWLGNIAPVTPDAARLGAAFRKALDERGFVEGRNVVYEYRFGEGDIRRYPALAAELAALNIDIAVVTAAGPGVRAVQAANETLPIVMVGVADPVGQGLVQSLARPGGNITGIADLSTDLIPKRIELLKAALPRVNRVAILQGNFGTFDSGTQKALIESQDTAARASGIVVLRVRMTTQQELEGALASIGRERVDALILSPNVLNFILRQELADFGLRTRLPIMASGREFVTSGALISYGASIEDIFRKAAGYVERILRGAKPGDLAIEQPTKFELLINMKTARALGLTIPQSLLLRADEVIE